MAMLTSTDLVEMGIKAVGARRKLLNQIMELKGELVGESAAAPDSTHPSQERLPPISPSRGVHKQVQGVEAAHQDASDNRPVPDQVSNGDDVRSALSPTKKSQLKDESAVKPDVVNLMAKLEADNDVLESIKEAASQLLAYEKEDSVANDSYFPGKFQGSHTMEIDVAFFRKRIQDRIDEYESKLAAHAPAQRAVAAPSSNAEDYRNGLPKVDYRAMIVEQAAHIAEMEKVHERYQELLDQCLQTVSQDLDKHASVGEYRDAGEYRLKMQLAKLIGMVDPGQAEQLEKEAATHQSRLGITQATLERRRLMQEEYDSLERLIDTDGNKLLDPSEIRRACQKDPTIQGRMEVLAFNLALDPEYRFTADDDKFNQETQAELERLVESVQLDDDGLLSREEIMAIPKATRNKLVQLGMPDIFQESDVRRGSLAVRRPSQPFKAQSPLQFSFNFGA
uniref:EF-hand domain-containing protein n=1 Tax=Eutreptiella gymnastica TaxID=73025 RepID=A0A7S4LAW8_9EUGL